MKVELRAVGFPVSGPAARATGPVAPQTSMPALSVTLPDGAIVDHLLQRAQELGLPVQSINQILLNGRTVGLNEPLHDGDAVTLIGQLKGD